MRKFEIFLNTIFLHWSTNQRFVAFRFSRKCSKGHESIGLRLMFESIQDLSFLLLDRHFQIIAQGYIPIENVISEKLITGNISGDLIWHELQWNSFGATKTRCNQIRWNASATAGTRFSLTFSKKFASFLSLAKDTLATHYRTHCVPKYMAVSNSS